MDRLVFRGGAHINDREIVAVLPKMREILGRDLFNRRCVHDENVSPVHHAQQLQGLRGEGIEPPTNSV